MDSSTDLTALIWTLAVLGATALSVVLLGSRGLLRTRARRVSGVPSRDERDGARQG